MVRRWSEISLRKFSFGVQWADELEEIKFTQFLSLRSNDFGIKLPSATRFYFAKFHPFLVYTTKAKCLRKFLQSIIFDAFKAIDSHTERKYLVTAYNLPASFCYSKEKGNNLQGDLWSESDLQQVGNVFVGPVLPRVSLRCSILFISLNFHKKSALDWHPKIDHSILFSYQFVTMWAKIWTMRNFFVLAVIKRKLKSHRKYESVMNS